MQDTSTIETTTLWRRVLEDPQLKDLPFKIETNQYGQIVLSPHKRAHSILQVRIIDLLKEHVDQSAGEAGIRGVELAIGTPKGVKVADAFWMSSDRYEEIPEDAEPTPIAPEICVEVLSGSNTEAEMDEKRALYLQAGAREVWMVTIDGTVRFFDETGAIQASKLVPSFPTRIEA